MDEVISFIKFLAQTNVVNFLLMIGIIVWIICKFSLTEVLDNSVAKVKESINKSEEEKEIAEKKLFKAQEQLANLPEEVAQIQKVAAEKEQILKQELENSASKSMDNIHKNAEKILEIEEKQISDSVTRQTITNSLEQAQNNIIMELKSNPQLHRQLIIDSLEEFERMEI